MVAGAGPLRQPAQRDQQYAPDALAAAQAVDRADQVGVFLGKSLWHSGSDPI
jgi:hypothetical protein